LSIIIQNLVVNITNSKVIESSTRIIQACYSTLSFFVSNMTYLNEMDSTNPDYPDYLYGSMLYHIGLFLSRTLAREPILSNFAPFVKE